jgi:hypothetical protein
MNVESRFVSTIDILHRFPAARAVTFARTVGARED